MKIEKQCKNCIYWETPHIHANGRYGKCYNNRYWINENLKCNNFQKRKKVIYE